MTNESRSTIRSFQSKEIFTSSKIGFDWTKVNLANDCPPCFSRSIDFERKGSNRPSVRVDKNQRAIRENYPLVTSSAARINKHLCYLPYTSRYNNNLHESYTLKFHARRPAKFERRKKENEKN